MRDADRSSRSYLLPVEILQRDFRDVNEGTVFLMNVYLNVMAGLQKKH